MDEAALDQAKQEISAVLRRTQKAGIVNDHELKHMDSSEKAAAQGLTQVPSTAAQLL